jgi:hypothetical protein
MDFVFHRAGLLGQKELSPRLNKCKNGFNWVNLAKRGQFYLVRVFPCVSVAKKMDINELTYQIRGAVFEVNRVLGAGFVEKILV